MGKNYSAIKKDNTYKMNPKQVAISQAPAPVIKKQ